MKKRILFLAAVSVISMCMVNCNSGGSGAGNSISTDPVVIEKGKIFSRKDAPVATILNWMELDLTWEELHLGIPLNG